MLYLGHHTPGNFQPIRKQQVAANLQASSKQVASNSLRNTCTMTFFHSYDTKEKEGNRVIWTGKWIGN